MRRRIDGKPSHRKYVLWAPLPICEWCDTYPAIRTVRVFNEEVVVCPACAFKLRMHDLQAYDRSHPGHKDNLVRDFPPETRARFTANGADAITAATFREFYPNGGAIQTELVDHRGFAL